MASTRASAPGSALLLIAMFPIAAACGRQMTGTERPDTTATTAAIQAVAGTRIFFAHQSVGDNIVEGLTTLHVRPVTLTDLPGQGSPFFAHARLGRNGDPRSKTDAFVAELENGLGDRLDVAFQKYCFADFDANTDTDRLFAYYRDSMSRLRARYPHLVILHVTAPLMVVQSGPKATVKKMLGRMPDQYAENFNRERFNDLLRREYEAAGLLFDLAAVESAHPDLSPELIRFRNQSGHTLLPEYSSDGGHLNKAGRTRVAGALVAFLERTLRAVPAAATAY